MLFTDTQERRCAMRFQNNRSGLRPPQSGSCPTQPGPRPPQPGPRPPQPGPRPPQPGPRPPQPGPRPPQPGPRPPQPGPRPPQPGPRPPQPGPRPPQPGPRPPQPWAGLPGLETPRSAEDLQKLLNQFGSVLTPQNQAMIQELITSLQQGSDPAQLQSLAARMSQALHQDHQD